MLHFFEEYYNINFDVTISMYAGCFATHRNFSHSLQSFSPSVYSNNTRISITNNIASNYLKNFHITVAYYSTSNLIRFVSNKKHIVLRGQ